MVSTHLWEITRRRKYLKYNLCTNIRAAYSNKFYNKQYITMPIFVFIEILVESYENVKTVFFFCHLFHFIDFQIRGETRSERSVEKKKGRRTDRRGNCTETRTLFTARSEPKNRGESIVRNTS